MAVQCGGFGLRVKLLEGFQATALVGVNIVPYGTLRYADHARHVVARIAQSHQVECMELTLNARMRVGVPLLVERLWKFVKAECLHGRYYPKFGPFKEAIIHCLPTLH